MFADLVAAMGAAAVSVTDLRGVKRAADLKSMSVHSWGILLREPGDQFYWIEDGMVELDSDSTLVSAAKAVTEVLSKYRQRKKAIVKRALKHTAEVLPEIAGPLDADERKLLARLGLPTAAKPKKPATKRKASKSKRAKKPKKSQ